VPDYTVIYWAVADFSSLTEESKKAKLTLRELQDAERSMNDSSIRGSYENLIARDRVIAKIREETVALSQQATAERALKLAQSGGNPQNDQQQQQQQLLLLERERVATDQLNRSKQRGCDARLHARPCRGRGDGGCRVLRRNRPPLVRGRTGLLGRSARGARSHPGVS
jgi:hypothetical protein